MLDQRRLGRNRPPEHDELTALKNSERYDDLRKVSEFCKNSLKRSTHGTANEPTEPRAIPATANTATNTHGSTITFKNKGFKLDTENNRVRLSKGKNTKDYWSDFALCARPDVDLPTVESVQQVRAVWTGDEWELLRLPRRNRNAGAPGESTVGIDLGIFTFAAGNRGIVPAWLSERRRLLLRHIANCGDSSSGGQSNSTVSGRIAVTHSLSRNTSSNGVEKRVGSITIGDLSGVREDEDDEVKNWGTHGNLDLHGWAFDRFTNILTYKAEMQGVENPVSSVTRRKRARVVGGDSNRVSVGCTYVIRELVAECECERVASESVGWPRIECPLVGAAFDSLV